MWWKIILIMKKNNSNSSPSNNSVNSNNNNNGENSPSSNNNESTLVSTPKKKRKFPRIISTKMTLKKRLMPSTKKETFAIHSNDGKRKKTRFRTNFGPTKTRQTKKGTTRSATTIIQQKR